MSNEIKLQKRTLEKRIERLEFNLATLAIMMYQHMIISKEELEVFLK